jgi:FtsP/CotA-like multicopper oxidase with cupredoxin domain
MIKKIAIISLLIGALLLGFYLVGQPQAAKAQEIAVFPPIYNLYATDGFVTMADGTRQYIYGFIGGRAGVPISYLNQLGALVPLPGGSPAPTGGPVTAAELPLQGNAQFPAPIIYAAVGEVVEIRLKNLGVTQRSAPNDPHTIHLHGMDVQAANDGVPETSVAAVPANSKFIGAGNVVVYMFSPSQAGTYFYHCHQEASIHVQMGMYGALVVYNVGEAGATMGPGTGGGALFGATYTKDVVLLLSEFDVRQHKAENTGGGYNPIQFQPQYWFINGLSFPNTIHAGLPGFNFGNWLLAHPGYDPFIVGSVSIPDKVLLRVINMGFQAQPMHMHGFHAKVIGSDQRAWDWGYKPTVGQGLEKNTLLIGSGETYEWLIDFSGQSLASKYDTLPGSAVVSATFQGGTQTRYTAAGVPSGNIAFPLLPAIPNPFALGFAYIGGPDVGPPVAIQQGTGGLPPELATGAPPTGVAGQFFPFHNHDDYKSTNNGIYPGGMFTMILTTP